MAIPTRTSNASSVAQWAAVEALSGPQADVASTIDRVSRCLLGVAENDMVKVTRIHSGPFNRRLGRHGPQFLRGVILDFSAITSEGRSRPTNDRDVSGFQHESC